MSLLDVISLFVCLAGIFLFINTVFLKLPSSIGLMLMALGLSLVILVIGFIAPDLMIGTERVMKDFDYGDVLYQIMLSFLLFAGALQIDFRRLAEEKVPVLILATSGVLVSTVITGVLIYYMLAFMGIELGFIYCLVFGALISPTDPVAVLALLKKYRLSKKLEIRIAGESLFNDGIAVVVALTLLELAQEEAVHHIDVRDVLWVFTKDVGGGVLIGLVWGYAGYRLLKFIDNDYVELEILVTLALVMTGVEVSQFIEVSAKQAAVVMGLVIGNEGKSEHLVNAAGDYVFKFWSLMDEALNAMLFVLIGLEMLVITQRSDYFAAGFFAFNIVLFSRWFSVAVPIWLMSFKRKFEKNTIAIMTWGGLRGGIPVALSLSLPDFEGKGIIVTMTYVVVVSSILYQGFTVDWLLKRSQTAS